MASEEHDPFGWVGTAVAGKYRVDAVVAEGGFGVLYRGHHLGLDSPIAIKCLKLPARLQGADRDRFLEAFVAEGKLLHRLSRETVGIVQALDVGADTSPNGSWTPYLVLEWLDGISLEAELAARIQAGLPGRSLVEAIALLDPAARALAVAHERGIVHRDIKPANLFLATIGDRPIVKVVDFGIAKVMTEVTSLTHALQATGASLQAFTPQYGAPEQFDRTRYGATGPWTDVFALALVLVEVMSGRPALDGSDTTQFFISSAHPERRPTPRQLGVVLPDAVEAVMARAVAVDPRQRFHMAGEFWDALLAASSSATLPVAATAYAPPISAAIPRTAHRNSPHIAAPSRPASPTAMVQIPASPVQSKRSTNPWTLVLGILAACVVVGVALLFVFAKPLSAPSPPIQVPPPPGAAENPTPHPTCPSTMSFMPADGAHKAFCIDEQEVTVSAFQDCVQKHQCRSEGRTVHWRNASIVDNGSDDSTRPDLDAKCTGRGPLSKTAINCVDSDVARAYCRASGKRLPTDDELRRSKVLAALPFGSIRDEWATSERRVWAEGLDRQFFDGHPQSMEADDRRDIAIAFRCASTAE